MQVRLLKHWNGYKPGTQFAAMPSGAGRLLIHRGVAVEVQAEGPADGASAGGIETAAAKPQKVKRPNK